MRTISTHLKPSIAALFFTITLGATLYGFAQNEEGPARNWAPGSPELIQPESLAKALKLTQKPVILYVGPQTFYQQAHIPGAEFIGATAKPEGLEHLRSRAASLKRDSAIVIYCGCCPWDHCPNIRPAYEELRKLGFANVKVLYLAGAFGTSWVEKGFPVEKGR